MDCIFCKIVKKEIPAAVVYEDDDVLAFLDIAPANKGHTLVVPKKHYEKIVDMPSEDLKPVFNVVKKITSALLKEHDGVNLIQNNGKAAGQLVNHVHMHLIPRDEDDGISLGTWETKKYEDNEIDEMKDKIVMSHNYVALFKGIM